MSTQKQILFTKDGEHMNKPVANHILDLARSGAPIPQEVITAALYVTGDAPLPAWEDRQDAEEFAVALLADVER